MAEYGSSSSTQRGLRTIKIWNWDDHRFQIAAALVVGASCAIAGLYHKACRFVRRCVTLRIGIVSMGLNGRRDHMATVMAVKGGGKTAIKSAPAKPVRTASRCQTCDDYIMSNDMSTWLHLSYGDGSTRSMRFKRYHKKCAPSIPASATKGAR